MSETQLLMEVFDFLDFFFKNKDRFLENDYILNEDIGCDGPGFQKNHEMRGLQLGFYGRKLWPLLPRNEIDKYASFSWFQKASLFLLYRPIVFFKTLKRATLSGNLKNLMPDFCLRLSYEALAHWCTQQYIPESLLRKLQN